MRVRSIVFISFFVGLALPLPGALAQATRTWVSGVGDDANPCSRTAPCKTFPGAISKTAANGTINCIDPGGFGAVTVTKSITIDCEGTLGSILAAGTNGVNINGAGIVVKLRHLSIEGAGTGLVGVNILNASSVHIEFCDIHGFQTGAASGIRVATGVSTEISIADTTLTENGTSAGLGGGILIAPTGAGGASVVVERVQSKNGGAGILLNGAGSTSPISAAIKDTILFGNSADGIIASTTTGRSRIEVSMMQSVTSSNAGNGIKSEGSTIAVGGSIITFNTIGVTATSGGRVFSFGNNQFHDNFTSSGAFTQTIPLQ